MQIGEAPSTESVEQARRMFRAVLAPWASDLLELRRRGLDRPGFRRGRGLVLRPAGPAGAGSRATAGAISADSQPRRRAA